MKNLSKQTKFILAVTAQLVIILLLLVAKLSIWSGGTEVLLKIEPVDPRDPLRGDYVTFQYDISNISRAMFKDKPKNGKTVYVPLRESGKYWSVGYGITTARPTNGLFIQGTVMRGGVDTASSVIKGDFLWPGLRNEITIEYGIEEYYIKEGSGVRFNFWNKESFAKVSIGDSGNAVIKQIYVDDEPWQ